MYTYTIYAQDPGYLEHMTQCSLRVPCTQNHTMIAHGQLKKEKRKQNITKDIGSRLENIFILKFMYTPVQLERKPLCGSILINFYLYLFFFEQTISSIA